MHRQIIENHILNCINLKNLSGNLFLFCFALFSCANSQQEARLPNTDVGIIFKQFLSTYNSGNSEKMMDFVRLNYLKQDNLNGKTEYWLDLYHRFGPIGIHSLSINQPFDLEVWLHGKISQQWFAVEFILDEKTKKIRATAVLQGDQPPNSETHPKSEDEFLIRIKNYLEQNESAGLFQGNVLIKKETQLLFEGNYGYANLELKTKNSSKSPMQINSISKVVTAIAALQLIRDGKLKLHQAIFKYLPDLPQHISSKITIYHILTHTSGYELDGITGFREELEKASSLTEVYRLHLKYLPKWQFFNDFNTLHKFNYSNDSYDLLAIIIENVSGVTFETYIKDNIFSIADMANTSFDGKSLAKPYRYDLKTDGLINYENYPNQWGKISGASGLKSTIYDLGNLFETLFFTDKLLDIPYKSHLFAAEFERGGNDFNSKGLIVSYSGALNLGHSGVNVGESSELVFFPESKYILVVLCNNRSGASNFLNFFKNNIPKN